MADTLRGSGRTTEQLRSAPKGAVFVWCNGGLAYPRKLARHMGRDDLTIVTAHSYAMGETDLLVKGSNRKIVVDHAYRV